MPPSKHYLYGPSSSDRWVRCPGSVLGDPPEKEESAAMRSGTYSHELAERMLRGERPTLDGDDERKRSIEQYVEFVDGLPEGERRIELMVVSEFIKDFGGTMDHLVATEVELYVTDFKDGKNPVSAVDNYQLKCYLCLAREVFPGRKRFFGSIVQPRVGSPQMQEYTAQELDYFLIDVMAAAASTSLKAGPHCRWCPHLGVCETEREYRQELVQISFDENTEIEKHLAVLGHLDVINELAKTARHKLLALALAGTAIPGYKLIRSIGNRAWTDPAKATKALTRLRFKVAQLFEPRKLLSPAKMEKLVPKEEVAKLVYRPDRGIAIVPSSSRAPEYNPSEMFNEENE